jgi:hypothetical protein
MLMLLMAHPHPNVLSDSSKVARFTLGSGTQGGEFLNGQGDQIKLQRRNHEGSVFYVRRSSTLIIICFFLRCFISMHFE